MTLKQQTLQFTEENATYSQADSLVSHSAQQVNDLERKMTATSGPKCLEQYERFNRRGLLAKTFVGLLIGQEGWYSSKCKLTWKLKATKCCRFYFQLQALGHPIKEREYGLLPTPEASNYKTGHKTVSPRIQRKMQQGWTIGINDLATLGMLPTPMASDSGEKLTGTEKQDSLTKRARLMTGITSQLNPRFVAEMMGFPVDWTLSPFQSGATNQ